MKTQIIKKITLYGLILFGLVAMPRESYAILDKATPDVVSLIKNAKDPSDAKSKICLKKGLLRGDGLSAGNQCKKTDFAQIFMVACQDDSDAMASKCAKNAKSLTKSMDLNAITTALGKSAGGIGTDANAILCKSDLSKLPPSLKVIADKSCGAPVVMAPVDMNKKTYNILSLDGGGIRGVGTAVILATIEMQTGKKIYELFDMIIGTSTGGLIAIMLSEGYSASKVLDFYIDNGPVIFQKTFSKKLRSVGGLIGTKFTAKQLEKIIAENIGDKKLGDSQKLVGVTSFNTSKGEQKVLSSWDKSTSDIKAGDAARATSAAPTYFKGKEIEGDIWIDGGVGANDPSTSAFLEAKRLFPEGAKIRVVSIGTGEATEKPLPRDSGILNVGKIVETLMKAGSEKSKQDLMQKLVATDKNLDYRRIQFLLPGKIDLADTRKKTVDILMQAGYQRTLQKDFIDLKNDLVKELNAQPVAVQ